MIEVENLNFTYMKKTPFEKTALEKISFKMEDGDFFAIAGPTGSGKSTLIQLVAGLINLQEGKIFVDGEEIKNKSNNF